MYSSLIELSEKSRTAGRSRSIQGASRARAASFKAAGSASRPASCSSAGRACRQRELHGQRDRAEIEKGQLGPRGPDKLTITWQMDSGRLERHSNRRGAVADRFGRPLAARELAELSLKHLARAGRG